MLGGFILSSSGIIQSKKYLVRSYPKDALSKGNKQSAEYLKLLRNNQHTGLINPKDLVEVRNSLSEMNTNRSGVEISWNELGPDNFGGRTRAIVFDNQDASGNTAIAASVSGGLWKTTDMGTTWSKINQASSNLNASCMIQTQSGDYYVGTGESFSANVQSGLGQMGYSGGFMGKGIFKSTDGDNFTLLSSTSPTLNDQAGDWAFVNELAMDQANGRLYTSTNTGLKYSDDGGSSWSLAKDADGNELIDNSTDVQAGTSGLVIASVNNLAYVSYDGNPTNFVLRSFDDSLGMLPATNVKRIEFSIAPSDENIVYASVVNQFEEIYNVYRSANKGESWDVVLPGSESMVILGGQGVYNNVIKVYPDNPNKLFIAGINLWVGEMVQEEGFFAWESVSQGFFGAGANNYLHVDIHDIAFRNGSSNQFLVGTDGGVYIGEHSQGEFTYKSGNRNYTTSQFYSVGFSGVQNYVIGGAQDNGSILITGKGNTAKQGKEIMGSGLAFQNGGDGGPAVISQINKDVLVASTTFGNVRRSDDGGENYSANSQFLDGIGNLNAFKTPMALWESFDNPNSRDSIMFYNRTGDTIPAGTNTMMQSANSGQPFYFDMPYELLNKDSIKIVDPVSSRFFLATANHIYMTTELHNFAKTPEWWEIANNDFTVFGGIPHCIAFSSDANHVFVGTQNGELFRISNLALAYNFDRADVSSPSSIVSVEKLPIYESGGTEEISQIITSISVDPQNANNILVTLGNYGNDQYIMYSTNALDQVPTFESKQGNLPKMPVYSSVIEMKDGYIAIIGTENGVFSTSDITATSPSWNQEYSAMGSVPVFELKQQLIGKEKITIEKNGEEFVFEGVHNKGLIYAATYGRGLFYTGKFWQPPTGVGEIKDNSNKYLSLVVYPNPSHEYVNIEIDATENTNARISIYALSGKLLIDTERMLNKGNNVLNLNIDMLKTGTYLVRTASEGKIYTNKIMVN